MLLQFLPQLLISFTVTILPPHLLFTFTWLLQPHPNTLSFSLTFLYSTPSKSTGFSPASVSFHLSVHSFKQMTLIPEILLPVESVSSSRFSCRPFCLWPVNPLPPDSYLSFILSFLLTSVFSSSLFSLPPSPSSQWLQLLCIQGSKFMSPHFFLEL